MSTLIQPFSCSPTARETKFCGSWSAGLVRQTPDVAAKLAPDWNQTLRNLAGDLDIPIMASLLNKIPPKPECFTASSEDGILHGFDVDLQPQRPSRWRWGEW